MIDSDRGITGAPGGGEPDPPGRWARPDELVTLKAAAARLGVPYTTLWNRARTAELRGELAAATGAGRRRLYQLADLTRCCGDPPLAPAERGRRAGRASRPPASWWWYH